MLKFSLLGYTISIEKRGVPHISEAFRESKRDTEELTREKFIVEGPDCNSLEQINLNGKIYAAHGKMIETLIERIGDLNRIKLLWCLPGSCSPVGESKDFTSFSAIDGYEVHFLYK
jgi:hypothetical protein